MLILPNTRRPHAFRFFQVTTSSPEWPCYYSDGTTNVLVASGSQPQDALLPLCRFAKWPPVYDMNSWSGLMDTAMKSSAYAVLYSGVLVTLRGYLRSQQMSQSLITLTSVLLVMGVQSLSREQAPEISFFKQ